MNLDAMVRTLQAAAGLVLAECALLSSNPDLGPQLLRTSMAWVPCPPTSSFVWLAIRDNDPSVKA